MTIESKLSEIQNAINDGADEIDYVINIGEAKMHRWHYIEEEMSKISEFCHKHKRIVKAILENCYLEKTEIKQLSLISKRIKPDFIKTSTGFGIGGATLEDIKLMKDVVGDDVEIKAAGGIRDLETCMDMINSGATRIGTSSSKKIIDELNKTLYKVDNY